MLNKQKDKEELFADQILEKAQLQQQEQFSKEVEKNEDMKGKLMDEYNDRIKNTNLSQADRDAMLQELNAKMSQIDDMIRQEEEQQNIHLREALERRRKGKDKLKNIVSNLAEKKDIKDKEYQRKLVEIGREEKRQVLSIVDEEEDLETSIKKDIDEQMTALKNNKLAETEKRLEDFRKKSKTPE